MHDAFRKTAREQKSAESVYRKLTRYTKMISDCGNGKAKEGVKRLKSSVVSEELLRCGRRRNDDVIRL
jgi:hypothetical protein